MSESTSPPGTGTAAEPTRGPRFITLADDLRVACQTVTEARFFYRDIFEKQVYTRHGVSLAGARTVLDVGANIGLFTLFASRRAPGARIYAFEPAKPIFELLRHNVARHAPGARAFPYGISDRRGTAELTFYPESSGMSSFHADRDEEKRVLRAIMEAQRERGVDGMEEVLRHADDLIETRFRSETVNASLVTLSDVFREHGIEDVDLLKVDVQKSELEVLHGIADGDWPKIRQIVVEVHDHDGRVERTVAELEACGYRVVAEQDDLYRGSDIYNLYAVRPDASGRPGAGGSPGLRSVVARAYRLRDALGGVGADREKGETE